MSMKSFKKSLLRICCLFVIIGILYKALFSQQQITPAFKSICNTSNSHVSGSEIEDGKCAWKFDRYEPSAWETIWYKNIDELQRHVCESLDQPKEMTNIIRMMDRVINLQSKIFDHSSRNSADELLSQLVYRYECNDGRTTKTVRQLIEPLIGLLRDPLTICSNFTSNIPARLALNLTEGMQSKRFLLLAPSAPYYDYNSNAPIPPWLLKPTGRKFLFDIGSSLFNGVRDMNKVGDAIGSRWFYQYFKNLSMGFDRIIAFERGQQDPGLVWGQIPEDALAVFTFINVAAEPNGKFNPLNILKRIAKPEDYVIFKLDIDVHEVESEFMQQILDNPIYHSLIDEMFFEMHVLVNEMKEFWGATTGELKDTYSLYTKLRQYGIRMHSWP